MTEPLEKAGFITHLLHGNNAMIHADMDKAIEEYLHAMELNPGFFLIYAKLGEAHYRKGEFEKAIGYFKHSLELNPQQTDTLYHLGKAYHESGMEVQAAVAYDLAMEKDRSGEYSSAIEKKKRRIRQHSSGRTLNELKPGEVFSAAMSTISRSPALLLPSIMAAFIALAADTALRRLIVTMTNNDFTPISLGGFAYDASEINPDVLIYYISMLAVLSLICTPLYGGGVILAAAAYRKKTVPFAAAMNQAFRQISALGGLAMIFFVSVGVIIYSALYIIHLLDVASKELMGLPLPIHHLTILIFPAVGTYLVYAMPSIAIEKQQMENGIKKAWRFGKKYTWPTATLLLAYTLIHFLANKLLGDFMVTGITIKNHAMAGLLMSPLQTFLSVSITLFFLAGQEVKRKKRREKTQGARGEEKTAAGEDGFSQEYDDIED